MADLEVKDGNGANRKLASWTDSEDRFYRSTIGEFHDRIHRGKAFGVCSTVSTPDTNYLNYLIKVGADEAHLRIGEIATEGKALVSIYESPTVTANGTLQSNINRNRNSANVSTTAVYNIPTANITTNGTQLDCMLLGGGTGNGRVGGNNKEDEELELKPNTDYLIRVQNLAGAAAYINLNIRWYHE